MMRDVHGKLNPGFPGHKQHSTRRKLFHQQIGLKIEVKKLINCYVWRTAIYGVKTWTFWKADQKYLESFDM